ncbi:hypothetical protein WQE_08572 [Paraburkholderia hospita]|uniref:Uncharacterized protein n=1 Tax=Paraburkholderia hospita TaxID=169430 RepID=A0ABP2PUQ1_9BURK|nr:hypothetical protein [Paraburkholderia hospita]EIN01546.1 hypothetical protein WQE_08572 [Paraburkholderia hospita]OUL70257.1 hypothetical protein CA602_48310 [Paraburkholderia hospita]
MNFDPTLPLDLDSRRQSLVREVPHALRELATLASRRTMPVCTFLYANELNGAFGAIVNDSVYLAVAIPESVQIDWAKQVSDWLIPHCEANYERLTSPRLSTAW